ncbi:cytochrome P450 [Parachaetomium inaequale]|uniref:Cytochrome P450 n=1 Tax=Parachaetomium inaequale TaxID=2588326 RepID=A0AAN6SML1_9PEZI|nr:cytochrome P450 [Parachaetomium inaequale]
MALSVGVLLGGLVTAYVLHTIWQWRRLAHVPGPFLAGFSKLGMAMEILQLRLPASLEQLSNKYGSLVRVGPNDLITDDPDVLRRMMAARSPYTRGPWYEALRVDPSKDNVLTLRDDAAHTARRAKILPGYSGKENLSMEGSVETQIAKLIELIETKYLSTGQDYRPMDWGLKAQYFTLDVISDLAWGRPMGFLEQDTDVYDYIKITTASVRVMLFVSTYPTLARALQSRFLRSILPKETDRVGFGPLIRIAKTVVAARFKPDAPDHRDMLGSFIRHGLDQDEASSESLLQIIAGSDTSATTIRSVMLNILSNPPVYQKLQAEIDKAIEMAKVSSPVKDAEGRQLPYLQAVIKEGLRVMPPASGGLFKQVPPGGDVIDGMFIPGGTQIGSSVMALHRSKKIYGPDAHIYRPERWLEAEGEQLARMNSTVDLIFHYGKYQCPGKGVAWMEFNKIFIEGIWLIEDLWLRVSRRNEERSS